MTMGQMPLSGEALGMLAEDAAFTHVSGKYFHSRNGVLSETRSSVLSYEEQAAVTLWSDSEQLTRLTDSERPVALRARRFERAVPDAGMQ
jgi:hypothetical protein